jgi:hypothetical protein
MTPYVFSTGTLASGAALSIPLAQHIDIGPFQEVDLVVRGHVQNIGASANIQIAAALDGWTPEDPANTNLKNLNNSTGTAIGSITLTGTSPSFNILSLPLGLGRLISIVLIANQPASTVTCTATISVDLVGKGGDPAGIMPSFNTFRGYR